MKLNWSAVAQFSSTAISTSVDTVDIGYSMYHEFLALIFLLLICTSAVDSFGLPRSMGSSHSTATISDTAAFNIRTGPMTSENSVDMAVRVADKAKAAVYGIAIGVSR